MNAKKILSSILLVVLVGCSGPEKTIYQPERLGKEKALDHYIQGMLLDQKGEYANAILEYQDAIQYDPDPAIFHSLAKDYSILGKHDLAEKNGSEAVKRDPANRTYRQTLAEIYINASDIDNAIKQYEELVKNDENYSAGWQMLAHLYQIKYPAKSLSIYENVIERFGANSDAYFQMGQIYHSMGKIPEAITEFQNMLSLEPENYEIAKLIGDLYLRQDSIDRALEIYESLADAYNGKIELHASIAHAHLLNQDYDKASAQFDVVINNDSLSIDEQIKFSQVFVSFIEKDSSVAPVALKMFVKIKEKYPSDWRPYWFMGAISNVMKNDSLALVNFMRVIDLAKTIPDGWIGAASIYYDKNKFGDAISLLSDAVKYTPEEFRIYFLLGISHQRLHNTIEAAASLEKAIQLNDKSVEALSALGLVYDEMKRYEDSDSTYERALRLDPENHLLLNNYGYSLAERGIQLKRALEMSKKAVEQQPENQSYLDTQGWIYFRMGNLREAENWIRKAVDQGSAGAVINEHLGDVYDRMGDKEKALIYWQKALDMDAINQNLKAKIQRGSQ